MKTINLLNLGAGVQSTTVLLRSLHGDLPPLDYVVFADTQWEPVAVYEHLKRLEAYAAERGVKVHRVTRGNLRAEYLASVKGGRGSGGERFASIPVFVSTATTAAPVRRQCTSEYKICPIEKFIRRVALNLKPRQRWPKDTTVRQWFGISIDEFTRTRVPARASSVFYYPLCGVEFRLENGVGRSTFGSADRWTRERCVSYLAEHWPHSVPRSACIGCPYHSDEEWQSLTPSEFADAVEFDAAIRRQANLDSEAFLHRSLVPLDQVVFRKQEKHELFADCEGMCGV